jgi:hypothetical protein
MICVQVSEKNHDDNIKTKTPNAESKFVIRITKFRYLSNFKPSIFYDPAEGSEASCVTLHKKREGRFQTRLNVICVK